jgi:asparagine synthase (glutamine-hydrolysing)
MTEKFVLREAARPFLTSTVYSRHKHSFLSPPAANNPRQPLNVLMQDTLRGSALASLFFYDRNKVTAVLDSLPEMNPGCRTAFGNAFVIALSACLLQERFGLHLS